MSYYGMLIPDTKEIPNINNGGALWPRGVRHPSCPEEEDERERERQRDLHVFLPKPLNIPEPSNS